MFCKLPGNGVVVQLEMWKHGARLRDFYDRTSAGCPQLFRGCFAQGREKICSRGKADTGKFIIVWNAQNACLADAVIAYILTVRGRKDFDSISVFGCLVNDSLAELVLEITKYMRNKNTDFFRMVHDKDSLF